MINMVKNANFSTFDLNFLEPDVPIPQPDSFSIQQKSIRKHFIYSDSKNSPFLCITILLIINMIKI